MALLILQQAGECSLKIEKTAATDAVAEKLNDFLAGIEKRAFSIARIATANEDEALDIVQDAMLKLASRYAHKPASDWPLLFHRILKNRICDWFRHQKIRGIFKNIAPRNSEETDEQGLENSMDFYEPGPEKRTMLHQTIQSIEVLLHSLPLRQQQAFIYRAWEELDTRATAKIMQCSEGSVKTHYSRAVHRLRSHLGESLNEK